MVDPAGVTRSVHPADVQNAADQGWSVETPEEAKTRAYTKENGGSLAEGAKAFGEHAAESATFGASTYALSQLVPNYSEGRQNRDVTFKGLGIAGDLTGYAFPGLGEGKVAGFASKALKAVGAPVATVSRVAGRLGSAAEHLAAGAAPGAVRRVVAKGVGGAVTGGLEGAAIGAGQALSESSIQNKDLTAELLLSHIRDGASIGGIMGAGLGAGVETLSATGKAIGGSRMAQHIPGVGDVLGAAGGTRGLEGTAEMTALQSVGFQGSDIKRLIKQGGPEAPHKLGRMLLDEAEYSGDGAIARALKHDVESGADFLRGKKELFGERVGEVNRKLGESGARIDNSSVLRAVDDKILSPLRSSLDGDDASIVQAIEHTMGPVSRGVEKAEGLRAAQESLRGFRDSVAQLRQLGSVDEDLALQSSRSLLEGSKVLRAQLREVGLDEAAKELGPVESMLRGMKPGKLEGSNFGLAERSVDRAAQRLERTAVEHGTPSMSYDELWKLRRRIDKDIAHFGATTDPRLQAYQDLRNVLKEQIAAQAERTGLAAEFRSANEGYHNWSTLEQVASQRAGSLAGNRKIGLTDTIAGGAGAGAGAVLGGGIGSVIGSLAATTGNKFMRSAAGDRLLATGLNKYTNWRNVVKAGDSAALDLATKTKATVEATPVKQRVVGLANRLTQNYENERQRLLEKTADKERMVDSLVAQLGDVRTVDPELANATIRAGTRGMDYLASVMPKPPGYQDLATAAQENAKGGKKKSHGLDVPDSQKAEFLRVAKVIDKPTSVLERAKEGRLTPAEVTAVRTAYPNLANVMASQAIAKATQDASRGKVPTYQQRLQLSTLTGAPLDATLRPNVINAYQQMFAASGSPPQSQQPAQPQLRAAGKAPEYASRRRNFTDREV